MNQSKYFQENLRTSTSFYCQHQQQSIRQPPQKIRQNKFTKTYSKLQSIPTQIDISSLKPKHIHHLYLSHNKIKSLNGIQQYINLQSFNVSYNNLQDIQQLNLIVNPEKIKHLGLKMNNFIYGYQDYVVIKFRNLQKLDDLDMRDKVAICLLIQKSENIASYFVEYHVRMKRVLQFMDDLVEKKIIHQSLNINKPKSRNNNLNYPNQGLMKLLTQNMTEKYIAKVSTLYSYPTEQDFRKINTKQIVDKIQKVIYHTLTEGIDLKCSCRPRVPLEVEMEQNYKEITSRFLLHFSNRFNKDLQKALKRIQLDLKRKYPNKNFQNYQLFGMLKNYISLKNGGKSYANIINQKIDDFLEWNQQGKQNKQRSKKMIRNYLQNQFKQQDTNKQNINPNILSVDPKQNNKDKLNFYTNKGQVELFFDRVPVIIFQKNYIEVLMLITMELIKQMLTKYDILTKNNRLSTKQFSQQKSVSAYDRLSKVYEGLSDKKQRFTQSEQKYRQKIKTHSTHPNEKPQNANNFKQAPLIQTARNTSFRNLNYKQKIFNTEAMLKTTVVNNSPNEPNYSQQDEIVTNQMTKVKTTPRPFSMLTRKDSQISFGGNQEVEYNDQIYNQELFQQTSSKNYRGNKESKQKNRNKNKAGQNNAFTLQNINLNKQKYSIYQINLIYKTFRGLKYRVIKRKRKQQKLNKKNSYIQVPSKQKSDKNRFNSKNKQNYLNNSQNKNNSYSYQDNQNQYNNKIISKIVKSQYY